MALKDALGSLGIEADTKKSSKKKTELPAFADKSLDKSITKFLAGLKAKKDAEAKMLAAHEEIASKGEEFRLEASRQKGEAQASITINGKIRFTQQGKYSNIGSEHIEALEEEFGDDAEQYVKVNSGVSIKSSVLSDKEKLQELIEAVGQDRFKDFFEITKTFAVLPMLHEKLSVDEKFLDAHGHLIEEGILKRNKATVVPV